MSGSVAGVPETFATMLTRMPLLGMTLNLVLLQLLLRFEKLGTGDTLEGALVSFSMFAERGIMICGETTIFNSTMELRQGEGLTLSLVS